MRILFLSHYFPPEVNAPATRTYEHCSHWVRLGHDVTIITCAPNHPSGKVYEGYRNRIYQREKLGQLAVRRVWTYVTANEGVVKRTLNYVSYMVSAVLAAPFLPKADIVISTSPQFFNGLAGYFVSRMKRVPWVLEIRDLWPESILAVGAIKSRRVIKVLEAMESFAYRRADGIVTVTDSFKAYMIEKGIDGRKIEVIKNGVNLAIFKPMEGDNPIRTELGLQNKFVVSYFGTHGMAHHLETALFAAEQLSGYPDIVFLFVGDGAEKSRLVKLCKERNIVNVMMLDQQPKDKMPHLWDVTDISLVLLKRSPLFETVIPSKIFESMAMEKPIILGVEGESKALLSSAGAGVFVPPEDHHALAAAIRELYNAPDRCKELGQRGRHYVSQHFDRGVLAERYASFLGNLAAPE